MHALSIVTIPAVSLRYRCGRAFSHSPTLVQVDAATMARLQADSALVVQVVQQQGDTVPPATSTESVNAQDTTQDAAPATPSPSRKPTQGKR